MRMTRVLGGLAAVVIFVAALAARGAEEARARPWWGAEDRVAEVSRESRRWLAMDEAEAARAAAELAEKGADAVNGVASGLVALSMADAPATDTALAAEMANAKPRALALLDAALARHGERPEEKITTEGSKDRINLEIRDLAYTAALRYRLTGKENDAATVKRILLRFAEVMPTWPLWDPRRERRAQDDTKYFGEWDGRGLWGVWFHMDLEASEPLLRAWDIIHDTLTPDERARIRGGVFDHQAAFIRNWPQQYGNMSTNHLVGLTQFALVLPEPDYVHEVVGIYRDMIYISYWPDGFFREASPSYHTMPAGRMAGPLPAKLKGYSDPPGYTNATTGERFDNLDLEEDFGRHIARWDAALDKLTLPDRTTLALNDALAGRGAWWNKRDLSRSVPRVIGTMGVGVLGHGEGDARQELYLSVVGTHGHEHHDALNFTWFAHGREIFSETDYRPPQGSDSTREWQASTAGHNTVVIDEADQPGRGAGIQREPTPEDALRGKPTWIYRNQSMNHGRLLMFDGTQPEVQVIEGEAERAYHPVAQRYRRTLALVPLEGGDGYLLDIFRVRGGKTHDYALHGGLDEDYEASFSRELQPATGMLYKAIRLTQQGDVEAPFSFSFAYKDGLRTTTHVVSPERGARLMTGTAPAMRRVGHDPFVVLRKAAGGGNTFVMVHESHKGAARVAGAELLPLEGDAPEAVAVRVRLTDGREDIFISTLGEAHARLADGTELTGRFGMLRREGGKLTALAFDGATLRAGAVEARGRAIEGAVAATRRVDAGDAVEAVVIEGTTGANAPADFEGQTLMVDLGEGFTWAYRITGNWVDDDRLTVAVDHEPGFEVHDGLVKMLYYPGWGLKGRAFGRIGISGRATGRP